MEKQEDQRFWRSQGAGNSDEKFYINYILKENS